MSEVLQVGIDVGSTTVKAVVMDVSGQILWKRYERHGTRQAALVRDFLAAIEDGFTGRPLRVFVTGSGGRAIAPHINASYIQEVNAVTYAVERLCPGTGSVVELGGQDAKVIIWKEDEQGRKSTLTFMNDKCAGGTGATIDKILRKSGVSQEEAAGIRAEGVTVHQVAAKCGVFAETDVVGLLKSGVSRKEIVASLGVAIVKQNLEVLVRGNVLRDKVVLLGGPHTYLKVLTDFWRQQIPETWEIIGWTPAERPLDELIYVPPDSLYFAAIGAVLFGEESEALLAGSDEDGEERLFPGLDGLLHYLDEGRMVQMMASGAVQDALVQSEAEAAEFAARFAIPPFEAPRFEPGSEIRCYLGIDGGSTSSKLVLLDEDGELQYKDYLLSQGNPIEDVRNMFARMVDWRERQGLSLEILGTGITGYASAILKEAFCLDLSVVETVAHMKSAVATYGDVDIICDIGGQDIKVLFMKHGRVVDFRLNTQCSAGNGYLLQTMAEQFGVQIEDYAAHAFRAQKAPAFNYGCAVFMEQDRVNFQQLGWSDEEIMAGLALVLPKNIWNYVVQEPHIARFGRRFVLQGGTQKNLAAVKAQVDYIRGKVPDAEVHVHRYADISGAIGVALEARSRLEGRPTGFIGIEQAARVSFETRSDEETRCRFCKNRCPRTFVDIQITPERRIRFISGNGCERGAADDVEKMRAQERERKVLLARHPNLVHRAAVDVFAEYDFEPLPGDGERVRLEDGEDAGADRGWLRRLHRRGFQRSSAAARDRRQRMVLGIPRLLNMYYYAPFFSTYFKALGVGRVVYSDYTSTRLWNDGNIWGAIDPCFPAKVAPAHIFNLLEKQQGLTHICFPMITHLESLVDNTLGNNACVIQMGTPEVVHAVFTKNRDHFAERGVAFLKPLLRMDRPREAVGELYQYFRDRLEITEDENTWAARQAFRAHRQYLERLRRAGREVIGQLIEEDRIGILVIGHPYHHDPGLNHGILEAFQVRGFPILCIESLPNDAEFLEPLFRDLDPDERVHRGFQINDVWMRNFNRNTNIKIWAARVAARHPNLAVIDLSSFKCGHDAPTYSYVESILDASETPHFLFHDIDQNKPQASLAIRIQTIEYFLREEEQRLRAASRRAAGERAS